MYVIGKVKSSIVCSKKECVPHKLSRRRYDRLEKIMICKPLP